MFAWIVAPAVAHPLVAVVLIDQEARDEGYAVELEDLVLDDALPVDVAEGEHVRIVDPDGGRHELDVAPGEAWEITGPRGEAWMSKLGEEVRTDLLVVRGDEAAVRALARALRAEVRSEDGGWLLVREGVLFDAPWVEAEGLEHLDEVGFVKVRREEPATPPSAIRPAIRHLVARPTAVAPVIAPAATLQPAPPARTQPVVPAAPVVAAQVLPGQVLPGQVLPGDPEPLEHRTAALDPEPYLGLYLCGDGTTLALDAGGFRSPTGSGDWYVSAPGVVRLLPSQGAEGRAAIEIDRHYCHAVW